MNVNSVNSYIQNVVENNIQSTFTASPGTTSCSSGIIMLMDSNKYYTAIMCNIISMGNALITTITERYSVRAYSSISSRHKYWAS